jgi:UDP-glucose 4-epimerase
MASILVTGGAGFIGSHLVDALLAEGHAVRVLDDLSTGRRANLDPRAELLTGCVTDAALVRRAAEDVAGIVHLAAIASVARSNEEWLRTHQVNQAGTVAVLEAARARRIPVVYASSAAIYGDQGEGAIAETARPAPMTAYGADKLGSELHAAVARGVHGVPTLGCRFFNVYGPRQDPASPYSGVIGIFAARIGAGQGLLVHGDGRQCRDFVYVADVVAHLRRGLALLQAEPAAPARVVNVCTGRATTILGLAEALMAVTGIRSEVRHGPARPGDIGSSLGDPSLARALLGIAAATSLEQGLTVTAHATMQGQLRALEQPADATAGVRAA